MRRWLGRKSMTLSSSVAQRVSPRFSPSYPNISETASSTNPSIPMRPLPMVLPCRRQFLLARPLRRHKTYCCSMLHPSPLVSPCRVTCSELSSRGTHLFQLTSPAYLLPSKTTRRPLRSRCMFLIYGHLLLSILHKSQLRRRADAVP